MKIDRQAILLSLGYTFKAATFCGNNQSINGASDMDRWSSQPWDFVELSKGIISASYLIKVDKKVIDEAQKEAMEITGAVIDKARDNGRCYCHNPVEWDGHHKMCNTCRRALNWADKRARRAIEKHVAALPAESQEKFFALRSIVKKDKEARSIVLNVGRSLICAKQLAKACNQSTTSQPRKSTRL